MEERAAGIILRTRPLTETSLIVLWLTHEFGRISTVAKGARRRGSPFLGKLDFCFEAEFSFIRSRRSELHTLKEVSLGNIHPNLRMELEAVAQAAYFTTLVERATETETPLPEIWRLFTEAVAILESAAPDPRHIFAFELRLLRILGFDDDRSGASAEGKAVLNALKNVPWAGVAEIPFQLRLAREVEQCTRSAIGTALGRLPSQREKLLRGRFHTPKA